MDEIVAYLTTEGSWYALVVFVVVRFTPVFVNRVKIDNELKKLEVDKLKKYLFKD